MLNQQTKRTVALYIRTAVRGEGRLTQEALLFGFLSSKETPLYLAQTRIFVDDGNSGIRANRPGLNALLDAVKSKQVDSVLVTDLARISRSPTGMFKTLSILEKHGCELWTVDVPAQVDLPILNYNLHREVEVCNE